MTVQDEAGLSRRTEIMAQLLDPSWRFRLRDKLLASQKFQRFAAAFPLTRKIAQKRAREVFELCAGFVFTQILYACVKLDVFGQLKRREKTLAELAANLSLEQERARRLLDAAVALQLLDRRKDGRYAIGPRGAVIAANPGILGMIEHHAMLYADLADPVALLKGEPKSRAIEAYWGYATAGQPEALGETRTGRYSDLMSASQTFVAEDIIAAYPFSKHRVLLDVGGGDGTFLRTVAKRCPGLELRMFDLPAVAERANANFAAAGIADRAHASGGNFFADSLPQGADLVTLIRIAHDHDDHNVATLFKNIRRALRPGSKLIVAEPMAGSPGAESMGDAYFGFYLMAMGSGRPRTSAELTGMLTAAGFQSVSPLRAHMPLQTSLLLATA